MTLLAATFLFLISCSLSLVKTVHAAEDACAPDPDLPVKEAINKLNKCAIQKDVFDDKLFNLNQLAGTTDSLYNLLTGKSQLHPDTDNVTAGGGALAASGKLVTTLYANHPVSGVQYFASEIQKFNPIQPAYAQTGIGYGALTPVKGLWTAFRNIAYVGFVIVFVIMGFMIMFRAHISPQAVATVQDSIPRIVIALILVTFSYAIAGLMIDIMFVFLNIAIRALEQQQLISTGAGGYVFTDSVFTVIWKSWTDVFGTVADALSTIIGNVVDLPFGLDKALGFFGGAIGALIVGIALIFIMFRIFFMLLMSYTMIIILTMAAPFFFLIQALPGNNGAKEWFKQMAANVSVFPVVALMFIFAGILGEIGALGGKAGGGITPEQIGQFPLLSGDIDTHAIGQLIAIGFLLMTPSAADMIKKFIGAQGLGGQGGVGAGAAAALGAGAGALGSAGRWAWGGPYSPLANIRQRRAIRQQSTLQREAWGEGGGTRDRGGIPPTPAA
ncbi:hypothetical protein A2165_00260 [Candidatus Curtissbacteria bacterium RBG_13_40_7]|uniref:TrbL/VirB6 plasmid conjugal transfer protein n=1 Tax=Candidatus Curtissbacteria bacterium RBG_13_40_7 TaxID=1797706 RepID=A0A1F5FWB4_9BACT|nr:MAG: hypothetical protein A2165_00260 [Candidatus Curtissbacteria bacterium RBG_13_40_7]